MTKARAARRPQEPDQRRRLLPPRTSCRHPRRHTLLPWTRPLAVLKTVKVLTVSEAALVLEDLTARTRQRDPDYAPSGMLLKAVEYAQRFGANKNRDTLQKIRE